MGRLSHAHRHLIVSGGLGTVEEIIASYGPLSWTDFSDLSLLFQDSAGTTPVTDNAQPIGRANTRAGSMYFDQSTGAARLTLTTNAINGLSVATGNGTQRLISSANASFGAFSVFAVFKDNNSAQAYERIVDHNYTTGWQLMRNNLAAEWGGGVLDAVAPYGRFVAGNNTAAHIIESCRTGTTHTITLDGTSTSGTVSASNTTSGPINIIGNVISGAQWGVLSVGEVLIFQKYLTPAQQLFVRTYLADKWAITVA